MAESGQARAISRGGITVVLTVLTLYLVNLFPTVKIFLFSLSTAYLAVMVIEDGKKVAFLTYLATVLLGLIILPNKLLMLPYVLYFGYYGILKSIFEQTDSLLKEWSMKLISFNLALLVFYIISRFIFSLPFENKLPVILFLIFAQLYFLIYDYAYSLFISYYHKYRQIINK